MGMMEEAIAIQTADGTADAVLYRQEGEERPGVIHLTDIGGIRDSQRAMARRLAEAGYTVLMPNLFYRIARPPVLQVAGGFGSEEFMKRVGELMAAVPPEGAMRDGEAYVDYLASAPGVKRGGLGVVGYCFSGAVALRIAAARPEQVGAVASFHGGGLWTEKETSPHLLLGKIKARLYFGHAVKDRSMPEEAIAELEKALAAWGGESTSEVYEGAYHSWTVPDSPVYNAGLAERAFGALAALLSKSIGSSDS